MKKKLWGIASIIVVIILITNPETMELAIFIDAVGLEAYLILIELHLIAIFSAFTNTKIRPVFAYIKRALHKLFESDLRNTIISDWGKLMIITPGPAALMNILVLAAIANVVYQLTA